ncbi:hypothetical protein HYW87_02235 [Candidatus Roizmanbacteria bacterium]|nr:hypothetical protein [Candidatus Roizmanbacteria bacterium]
MPFETLSRLLYRTPMIVGVREHYYRDLMKQVKSGVLEEKLPFASKNMYECWVNYAPHFFTGLRVAYDMLLQRGHRPEDLLQFAENKFRVVRYYTQILLPGAYLDRTIQDRDKFHFLNNFAKTAESVLQSVGYNDDIGPLFTFELTEKRKISIGRLIQALNEACESIYFGDQPVGFPSFGLDTSAMHDYYVLFKDFDLNLGQHKFQDMGRVQTIVTYDKHAVPPYRIFLIDQYAQLFYHREWINKDKPYNLEKGAPPIEYMTHGGVSMDGKQLSTDQINELTERVINIILQIREERKSMKPQELNLEYCASQSGVIANMNGALGREWQLSKEAKESIFTNRYVDSLKKEWELKYGFEVALEAIKRSIEWAKKGSA